MQLAVPHASRTTTCARSSAAGTSCTGAADWAFDEPFRWLLDLAFNPHSYNRPPRGCIADQTAVAALLGECVLKFVAHPAFVDDHCYNRIGMHVVAMVLDGFTGLHGRSGDLWAHKNVRVDLVSTFFNAALPAETLTTLLKKQYALTASLQGLHFALLLTLDRPEALITHDEGTQLRLWKHQKRERDREWVHTMCDVADAAHPTVQLHLSTMDQTIELHDRTFVPRYKAKLRALAAALSERLQLPCSVQAYAARAKAVGLKRNWQLVTVAWRAKLWAIRARARANAPGGAAYVRTQLQFEAEQRARQRV